MERIGPPFIEGMCMLKPLGYCLYPGGGAMPECECRWRGALSPMPGPMPGGDGTVGE